jgi:hypothetical protein
MNNDDKRFAGLMLLLAAIVAVGLLVGPVIAQAPKPTAGQIVQAYANAGWQKMVCIDQDGSDYVDALMLMLAKKVQENEAKEAPTPQVAPEPERKGGMAI